MPDGLRSAVRRGDQDLKSRGLLDDTLVVCGSEFGRTPVVETGSGNGIQNGRDHNPFAFMMWKAGGGVKGGLIYGATDDFGFKVVDKPVHVRDLHATNSASDGNLTTQNSLIITAVEISGCPMLRGT